MSRILLRYSKKGSPELFGVQAGQQILNEGGRFRTSFFAHGPFSLTLATRPETGVQYLETTEYYIALAGRILDKEGEKPLSVTEAEDKKGTPAFHYWAAHFLQSGATFPHPPEGEYTWICYHKPSCRLTIMNDRYGGYPLFIGQTADHWICSNAAEPIYLDPAFKRHLDLQSVQEYLEVGSIQDNRTFLQDLFSLKGGQLITFNGNQMSQSGRPQKSGNIPAGKSSLDESLITETFVNAVRNRTQWPSPDPCMISLTGGMDTRAIVSALDPQHRKNFHYHTIVTPPLDPEQDSEFVISSQIAQKWGLSLETSSFNFWGKDFDESFFTELRRDYPWPVLSGHYGSEIFKAEFYYLIPPIVRQRFDALTKEPLYLINPQKSYTNFSRNRYLLKDRVILNKRITGKLTPTEEIIHQMISRCPGPHPEMDYALDLIRHTFFSDFWKGSRGLDLCQPWRVPLKFSCPFLDAKMLDLALSHPYDRFGLGHDKLYNCLIRNVVNELKDIPTNSNYANHEGAVVPFLKGFSRPYDARMPRYQNALRRFRSNPNTWNESLYSSEFKSFILKTEDVNDNLVVRFIDFEAWRRHAGLIEEADEAGRKNFQPL